MTWMLTASGAEFHLQGWRVLENEVRLPDVAHSLAQINRFTGHARRPYSVAEHSLLAAQIAREQGHGPAVQLAALLHDAHEAYTGDVSSPVKWTVGAPWGLFEAEHAQRVARALGVWAAQCAHRRLIKHIDLVCLATERRDLLAWDGSASNHWPILDTPGGEIEPWPEDLTNPARAEATWEDWRQEFLCQATTLRAALEARMHEMEATK